MAAVLTFDVAAFRIAFPAFSNSTTFPDALLEGNWDSATCIMSDRNCGWLRGRCRERALNLLTAHLTALGVLIAAGETPGMLTSATIDKVTVSLTPPPLPNQWQWWLGLTPYGQQYLALMQARSVGGFMVGGNPEVPAMRRGYGRIG